MSLNRASPRDIPKDGVMLTKDEAVKYQSKLLYAWKDKSDTFAFRHGISFLGGLAAATSIYLNNYYRSKLHIGIHGRLTSYLPIVVIPSVCSAALHFELIIPKVLLQNDCPICVETRAAVLQTTIAAAIPAVLAPLSAFPIAVQYLTYDVPYITKEPRKVFEIWKKINKPISNVLFLIFLGQALAGALVTHFEAKSVHKVNKGLLEIEKSLDEQNETF